MFRTAPQAFAAALRPRRPAAAARSLPRGAAPAGPGAPRRPGLRRRLLAAALAFLPLVAPARAEFADGWREAEIVRLSDGARLPGFAALVEAARGHDLVIVGEIHDNPRHQRLQAALARALDVPALALEMVPAAAEEALSRLRAAGPDAPADLRDAAGWDDYAPWHGVLGAVPAAEVAGAGVARDALRRAMAEGAAAAFDGDAAAWGLTSPLPPETQAALEADLYDSHCRALPEAMLPAMAEAQRLRDASFAAALLRARDRAGRGPALLVAGDGHVRRDRGAPAYLAHAAPELSVLAIAQIERRPGETAAEALAPWTDPDGAPVFDLAVLSEPAEREDPCAAFRN